MKKLLILSTFLGASFGINAYSLDEDMKEKQQKAEEEREEKQSRPNIYRQLVIKKPTTSKIRITT